jgi:hypothetical protein
VPFTSYLYYFRCCLLFVLSRCLDISLVLTSCIASLLRAGITKWVTCPWLMHRVIHKWLLNSCNWDACVSSNTRYVVCLHSTAIRQNMRYAIVCYNSSSLSHHIYLSILNLSLIVCIIHHCVHHRVSHDKNTRLRIRSRRYMSYMNKLNLLKS